VWRVPTELVGLSSIVTTMSPVLSPAFSAGEPEATIPTFMESLRSSDGIAPRALEFAILTAARTSEVLRATWGETLARASGLSRRTA
jgi:hypothetical protein